jgi:pyridoxal phosphate enzyme (YggS family)
MREADHRSVADRLADVRRRIDSVERPWTHPVSVTAVTKGFGPEVILAAANAGFESIGENYAQELLGKVDTLDSLGGRRPSVEFIGRLQSNKVRQLVGVVDLWASVDRRSLVDEIAKRAPGAHILIQVNSTGEDGKGGAIPAVVPDLVGAARAAGLDVAGLMTVGPTDRPPEAARPGFDVVRRLVDELDLDVCSMGMSGDLEVAVAAGSTNVRVGTALFGPRR